MKNYAFAGVGKAVPAYVIKTTCDGELYPIRSSYLSALVEKK